MISITQDLKFKQAVVEYSFKHGVGLSNICYTLKKKEERNSLGDFQPKGRIGKLLYSFMYLLNCLL